MLSVEMKQDITVRVGNRVYAEPKSLSRAVGVFTSLLSPEKYGREFGYVVTGMHARAFRRRLAADITGHKVKPMPRPNSGLWEHTKHEFGLEAGSLTAQGHMGNIANIEVKRWAMSQHLVRFQGQVHGISSFKTQPIGAYARMVEYGYTLRVTEPMARFFKFMVLKAGWPEEWLGMAVVDRVIDVGPKPFFGATLAAMEGEGVFEKLSNEALEARMEQIAKAAVS